jgi:hypothetical protein
MYLGFPLASNFLRNAGGWTIARIGMLGSFQALGAALLNPLLGRMGKGTEQETIPDAGSKPHTQRKTRRFPPVDIPGLAVGQTLVWISVLILLLAGSFPLLALAYLLRGTYQVCCSLTRAQATTLASEANRGLLLGATETIIAASQIVAPYAAGWLYASHPTYPFVASLILLPIMVLLALVGQRP